MIAFKRGHLMQLEETRKVRHLGSSLVVAIPRVMCQRLDLVAGDSVVLTCNGDTITVEKDAQEYDPGDDR